eukprot:7118893-Prymnesium_polylepis.1
MPGRVHKEKHGGRDALAAESLGLNANIGILVPLPPRLRNLNITWTHGLWPMADVVAKGGIGRLR